MAGVGVTGVGCDVCAEHAAMTTAPAATRRNSASEVKLRPGPTLLAPDLEQPDVGLFLDLNQVSTKVVCR